MNEGRHAGRHPITQNQSRLVKIDTKDDEGRVGMVLTSFCDWRTTLRAMCALMSRMRSMRGYIKSRERSSSVKESARARDAVSTILSVTLEERERIAPRPRPIVVITPSDTHIH